MNHSERSKVPDIVMSTSGVSLLCLFLLHFFSPEFEPNWRMVSEYALGKHKWIVSLFFIFWGLSSILLAISLWNHVNSKAAKVGVVFLFISGIGASLAALLDVSQPIGHGIAALLGIPTVPIAALLITFHLTKKQQWISFAKPIKILAHGTWVTLILMVVTMVVMLTGFQNAGIIMGPESPPPLNVPDGVIALVGYVNRLLILVDVIWLIFMARAIKRISYVNLSDR